MSDSSGSGYIGRFQYLDHGRSVLFEATEAIAPVHAEVFGPFIERINVRFGQYARCARRGIRAGFARDLTTFLEQPPALPPDAATGRRGGAAAAVRDGEKAAVCRAVSACS